MINTIDTVTKSQSMKTTELKHHFKYLPAQVDNQEYTDCGQG
jgi:hypothetical protein